LNANESTTVILTANESPTIISTAKESQKSVGNGLNGLQRTNHSSIGNGLNGLQRTNSTSTTMLQTYGHNQKELILMVQDFAQYENDERLFRELEDEKLEDNKANNTASLELELDEQRAHDFELRQLHEDVLYHANTLTEEIIASFEHPTNSPVHEFNEAST
jgi:hypothetical protein